MNRLFVAGLAAIATLSAATGANAAITVIGASQASECAQAARAGRSDRAALNMCENALGEEMLTIRDRAKTQINRGVIRMRQLNWTDALADMDQAIAMQGDIGEAYVNRGAVLIGMRRYQEGLEMIDRGLVLGIDDPAKAYYNRGLAHEGLENARDAYLDYQQAVTLAPRWDLPQQQLLRFTVTRR